MLKAEPVAEKEKPGCRYSEAMLDEMAAAAAAEEEPDMTDMLGAEKYEEKTFTMKLEAAPAPEPVKVKEVTKLVPKAEPVP